MDNEQRAFLIGKCLFTETDCDEVAVIMATRPSLSLRDALSVWCGEMD